MKRKSTFSARINFATFFHFSKRKGYRIGHKKLFGAGQRHPQQQRCYSHSYALTPKYHSRVLSEEKTDQQRVSFVLSRYKNMEFEVNSCYGLIVILASLTYPLNMWQTVSIFKMREKLGVNYPAMTSDKHPIFNCYQRAHLNTLELVGFYIFTLLIAGVSQLKFSHNVMFYSKHRLIIPPWDKQK